MDIKPLADNVLIKASAQETVSKGGIVLPGTVKESTASGEVIAIGLGKRTDSGDLITPQVSVGDKVLYRSYSGAPLDIDGEDYRIVKESEIMAIIANQ